MATQVIYVATNNFVVTVIVAPVRQILILQTAVRACGAVRAGVRLVRQ